MKSLQSLHSLLDVGETHRFQGFHVTVGRLMHFRYILGSRCHDNIEKAINPIILCHKKITQNGKSRVLKMLFNLLLVSQFQNKYY